MISIGTSNVSNRYYFQNPPTTQNSNNVSGSVSNPETEQSVEPLTEDELDLAKTYQFYLNFNAAITRFAADSSDANREAFHEQATLSKQNPHQLRVISEALGLTIIDFDPSDPFKRVEPTSFGLPKKNFSFDRANNSFTFGNGSKINLGDHSIHVEANRVTESPYSEDYGHSWAITEIAYALKRGSAHFKDEKCNEAVLALLDKIGIDTTKDFKINGLAFELKDGFVQTKDYSPFGIPALQSLLTRAYEQNLM